MGNILSSLFRLIWAIFSKLVKWIVAFVKKYWWVILIVVAIYFAPVITAYLTEIGAPSWLTSVFSTLSSLTPSLTSAIDWFAKGASSLASSAWGAFSNLGIGTKIALATGVAAALAPEETADLLSEFGSLAADVITTVGAGLLSGDLGTWLLVGLGAYFWFTRDKEEAPTVAVSPAALASTGGQNGN